MTIRDLMDCTVQANRLIVRTYTNDSKSDEIVVADLTWVDDLCGESDLFPYEDCEVTYIYPSHDTSKLGNIALNIDIDYEDYEVVVGHLGVGDDEEEEEEE